MRRFALLAVFLILTSCATVPEDLFPDSKITLPAEGPEVGNDDIARLKDRVNRYWGFRIKNDYIGAFDYEDPLTKETYEIDLQDYLSSKSSITYNGIRITEVDFLRPDYAKVRVLVKYTFEYLEKMVDEKDVIDKWVKRPDGKWYRIFTTNIGQAPLEE